MSITYEELGHVALITIRRPEARNAVNGAVATGIEEAIDRLEAGVARVGIITGDGPTFSAGADLKLVNQGQAREMITKRGGFGGIVIRDRTKPIIAAVNGPALAGGCEIALACDLIVAARDASFGLPEVKRCLLAGAGGLFRLARALPPNLAMEAALTGDPISAEIAHAHGLVNALADPGHVVEAALALAERIAANSPVAVVGARRAVIETTYADDPTAWRITNELRRAVEASDDCREGVAAFVEKRPPSGPATDAATPTNWETNPSQARPSCLPVSEVGGVGSGVGSGSNEDQVSRWSRRPSAR